MIYKAVLLDIEGTTTPINFVHETLFGFARARLFEFVQKNIAELNDEIALLEVEHRREAENGTTVSPFDQTSVASIVEFLNLLIDHDRKSTALKSIQGKIWQAGYYSGELRGEVFADVPAAFERWRKANIGINIFSSGSVLAQKLLFKHSTHGDLSEYVTAYFDTTTGAKREAASYQKIAAQLNLPPAEIVFVSDITEELDAAQTANMQTLLSVRPGNAPSNSAPAHRAIQSFDQLD